MDFGNNILERVLLRSLRTGEKLQRLKIVYFNGPECSLKNVTVFFSVLLIQQSNMLQLLLSAFPFSLFETS